MLKMLQAALGVAFLIVGISSQANDYNVQDGQNCRGDSQANPASSVTAAPSGSAASSSRPHSVRLSWNASIPASHSPQMRSEVITYRVATRNRTSSRCAPNAKHASIQKASFAALDEVS